VNKLETLVPPGVFGNPLLAFVRGSLEATTFSAIFQFKEATPTSQVRKTAVMMFVTCDCDSPSWNVNGMVNGMGMGLINLKLKLINFLQFFTDPVFPLPLPIFLFFSLLKSKRVDLD